MLKIYWEIVDYGDNEICKCLYLETKNSLYNILRFRIK